MRLNPATYFPLVFLLLLLSQILVFNNIQWGGYINPYIYILFIMLLPIDVPGWLLLTLAFITGLIVDMFLNSMGIHAAATVFMAFCRPMVIRLISVKSDFEPGTIPNLSNQKMSWIMTYSTPMVLAHHVPLFFLEVFRFAEFWSTMSRIIQSSLFSLVFIVIAYLIIGKNKSRSTL